MVGEVGGTGAGGGAILRSAQVMARQRGGGGGVSEGHLGEGDSGEGLGVLGLGGGEPRRECCRPLLGTLEGHLGGMEGKEVKSLVVRLGEGDLGEGEGTVSKFWGFGDNLGIGPWGFFFG